MRVLLVTVDARLEELSAALRAEGISVDRAPETPADEGDDEIGGIAEALRTFERVLTERAPDAVVLGSASNAALAAALVATKLSVRVARLQAAGSGPAGPAINRALIEQLGEAELAATGGAVAAWLRL